MTHIDFHFDPVSPGAWLAFERLPPLLEGLSYSVAYRPLLLGALLQHRGQKGPAEIAPKRDGTSRQMQGLAQRHGIALQLPAQHPFNPLSLLRLLVACAPAGGTPGRWACEQVLRHVWCGDGADANEPARLQALAQRLAPQRDAGSAAVEQELGAATAAAIGEGMFGVPSCVVGGRLFWGLDGLEMLAAQLHGDAGFADGDGNAWDEAASPRPGIQRRS